MTTDSNLDYLLRSLDPLTEELDQTNERRRADVVGRGRSVNRLARRGIWLGTDEEVLALFEAFNFDLGERRFSPSGAVQSQIDHLGGNPSARNSPSSALFVPQRPRNT